MFRFYTSWKHKKTSGFWRFQGVQIWNTGWKGLNMYDLIVNTRRYGVTEDCFLSISEVNSKTNIIHTNDIPEMIGRTRLQK